MVSTCTLTPTGIEMCVSKGSARTTCYRGREQWLLSPHNVMLGWQVAFGKVFYIHRYSAVTVVVCFASVSYFPLPKSQVRLPVVSSFLFWGVLAGL